MQPHPKRRTSPIVQTRRRSRPVQGSTWLGATTIVGGLAGLALVAGLLVSLPSHRTSTTRSPARWSFGVKAATVNRTSITNADFQRDRAVLLHYVNYSICQSPNLFRRPTTLEVNQIALDRLIRNAMVDLLAEQRGVQLTQAEVDADFTGKIAAAQLADVSKQLRDQFGMSIAEYKSQIVRPYLLMDRLQWSIAFDEAINAGLTAHATEVATLVAASKDSFESLAKTYSEDPNATSNGGDLGSLGAADLPPEVYAAALKLKVGERSGLIRSVAGYHIIELVEAVPTDQGAMPPVHLRQILISVIPVDTWISQELAAARVRIFVRGLRWDGPSASVLPVTS